MKKINNQTEQSFSHNLAEIISWAFFPPLVATVFFVFLTFWYSSDLSEGFSWLVTVSPFLIFVPLIFFAVSYKLGWVSDIDLTERKERPLFLVVFVSSLLVLSLTLYFLKVPEKFFVYAFSGLIMTAIASIITLYWKISFHTAITGSVVMAILILGGLRFWPLILLAPIVGWSRVILGKHSVWQVTGGTLLSFFVTYLIFHFFNYRFFY
ncbi:MAG: PAP2 superfamily protein [candidate division WS2 bacterium ADurb.Bin280]|uniref:PAP2 superfamily protein n=1 Tax=candidate division WS2 bacterium ADurb.Bin280 TaxID=1852829 RepID=A0A1V5SCM1_9BACT|nr:MAG: PAP2 superfamily protein [candidate division WS2 bacterium ADurb.Bin280]